MDALTELRTLAPDVVAAAIVGLDGQLEGTSGAADMEHLLGPTTTTLCTIAERAAQELGRGALDGVLLQAAYGNILARYAADGRIVVVVAEPGARLGLLLDDVRACADRLSGVAHV